MATSPTKQILERLLAEQQGAKVPPELDLIAKKMALLKGKPEDKYKIFIQLLPQLLQAFGGSAPEAQADPRLQGYDVQQNIGPAMPPPGTMPPINREDQY